MIVDHVKECAVGYATRLTLLEQIVVLAPVVLYLASIVLFWLCLAPIAYLCTKGAPKVKS